MNQLGDAILCHVDASKSELNASTYVTLSFAFFAARFMELVRAEELSNFLNRADNSSISREEISKRLG